MKKSYKRLIIFQLIMALVLILNSFVFNLLSGYVTIAFLLISLLVFKFICGFEKDRHRYIKDILFDIAIFLLIYFLLYYLLGVIIGFAKIGNYYSINGLISFIIPTILTIVLTEILRYEMLVKSEVSKKLIILNCVLFIFLDVSNSVFYGELETIRGTFMFLALTLLPSITKNILGTYLSIKFGYKPMIFYLLITTLYKYFIPIVPNPNEFLASIIQFLLPVLLFTRALAFGKKEHDEELERDYHKKSIVPYLFPTLLVVIAVYFTSGYFRFYAVAIASGSMMPNINKGDVVIVDKDYKSPEIGQVIAFRNGDIVVVHRLINIIDVGESVYYYTQGDANPTPDDYVIERGQIIGVVNVKVPYIGTPTVWMNEL